MLSVSITELRHEVDRQLGRLHDDETKNTGFVQVKATDMRDFLALLDALEAAAKERENEPQTKYQVGDTIPGVECPDCGCEFDYEV